MEFEVEKFDIRERTIRYGISYPVDEELIMLILGSGTKQMSVDVMARKIKETLDSTNQDELLEKLISIKGIGKKKALTVIAALELGKRRSSHLKAVIQKPCDLIPFVRNYSIANKEHFLAVTLNGGHEIIQIHVISVGTLDQTLVHPREVFYVAVKENASALIVCHNHPSGNVEPSEHDIETTRHMLSAAEVMGIPILDHIIIGYDKYFSFREHKLVL